MTYPDPSKMHVTGFATLMVDQIVGDGLEHMVEVAWDNSTGNIAYQTPTSMFSTRPVFGAMIIGDLSKTLKSKNFELKVKSFWLIRPLTKKSKSISLSYFFIIGFMSEAPL